MSSMDVDMILDAVNFSKFIINFFSRPIEATQRVSPEHYSFKTRKTCKSCVVKNIP